MVFIKRHLNLSIEEDLVLPIQKKGYNLSALVEKAFRAILEINAGEDEFNKTDDHIDADIKRLQEEKELRQKIKEDVMNENKKLQEVEAKKAYKNMIMECNDTLDIDKNAVRDVAKLMGISEADLTNEIREELGW